MDVFIAIPDSIVHTEAHLDLGTLRSSLAEHYTADDIGQILAQLDVGGVGRSLDGTVRVVRSTLREPKPERVPMPECTCPDEDDDEEYDGGGHEYDCPVRDWYQTHYQPGADL